MSQEWSLSNHIFAGNHADSFRIRRASRGIKRTCITRWIRASYRFTLIGFYALYMHAAMDIRVHGPPRVRRLPYSILFCQYEIPNLQLHASVHDRPRTRFRFSLLICRSFTSASTGFFSRGTSRVLFTLRKRKQLILYIIAAFVSVIISVINLAFICLRTEKCLTRIVCKVKFKSLISIFFTRRHWEVKFNLLFVHRKIVWLSANLLFIALVDSYLRESLSRARTE